MKQILLIMGEQSIHPENVLTATDGYPGEYLWGYRPLCNLLGNKHVDVIYTARGRTSKNILFRVFSAIVTKFLGDMIIVPSLAFRLWQQRREIEAVFITANIAIFTTVVLRMLGCGFRVYPLLLGWPEFKFSQMHWMKYRLWMLLLQKTNGILALGIEESEVLQRQEVRNVKHLTFGVDTDFWAPANGAEKDFIFSVGADPNRDFKTLFAANVEIPIVLCTPMYRVKSLSIPKNVSVVQGSYFDVRKWFHEARVVVIPIMDTVRPSGQVSILQAMATGKTVITTRTRGRWTDKLINGENCILVSPEDPDELRQSIYKVYNNSALAAMIGKRARKTVLDHFTISHYVKSLVTLTEIK